MDLKLITRRSSLCNRKYTLRRIAGDSVIVDGLAASYIKSVLSQDTNLSGDRRDERQSVEKEAEPAR
jgi:hypothetical protein